MPGTFMESRETLRDSHELHRDHTDLVRGEVADESSQTFHGQYISATGPGSDHGVPYLARRASQESSILGIEYLDSTGSTEHEILGVGSTFGSSQHEDDTTSMSTFEKKRRFQGWRFGATCVTAMTWIILSTNIAFLIVAATLYPNEGGIATIYEGEREVVGRWSQVLHIIINVLSSALLAASNYTMQFLAAPTREEINTAHAKSDWLEIGVPSLKNVMGRVAGIRCILWWLLCLSSLPIHLVFNSVAFKTTGVTIYATSIVAPEFFDHRPLGYSENDCAIWFDIYDTRALNTSAAADPCFLNSPAHRQAKKNYTIEECPVWQSAARCRAARMPDVEIYQTWPNISLGFQQSIQTLSGVDCEAAYRSQLVSGHANLLLVSRDFSARNAGRLIEAVDLRFDGTSIHFDGLDHWMDRPGFYWTYASYPGDGQAPNSSESHKGEWWLHGYQIDSCLYMKVPGHCKIQASLHIFAAVIVCNAIKAGVMAWAMWCRWDNTLVTAGDCIASFLVSPEQLTNTEHNITSLPDAKTGGWWDASTPKWRWLIAVECSFVPLSAAAVLLTIAVLKLSDVGATSPFSNGFGTLDPRAMVRFGDHGGAYEGIGGLVRIVLLVNTPQIICSLAYYTHNGLLTCMSLNREWNRYYLRKKPLRVSDPCGDQRSTYFLSLPYRYGLPLLAASTVLHWLISQSLFLVRLQRETYSASGDLLKQDSVLSQAGFSALPMLMGILLGLVIWLCLIWLGCRTLDGHMPIAGCRSDKIAAACHRPDEDVHAAYKSVSWGELAHGTSSDGDACHCTFTSKRVYEPCAVRRMVDADEQIELLDAQSLYPEMDGGIWGSNAGSKWSIGRLKQRWRSHHQHD